MVTYGNSHDQSLGAAQPELARLAKLLQTSVVLHFPSSRPLTGLLSHTWSAFSLGPAQHLSTLTLYLWRFSHPAGDSSLPGGQTSHRHWLQVVWRLQEGAAQAPAEGIGSRRLLTFVGWLCIFTEEVKPYFWDLVLRVSQM